MRLPRALFYLLLVPVIGFELWVVSLAGATHVPAGYRAYFIDKTTDCWPLEVSGAYTLGTVVSLVAPRSKAADDIRRCGWLGPQDTGTWSTGPEAQLRFAVAGPPDDLVLDLEILGFVTTAQPAQNVHIFANGAEIALLRLTADSNRHQLIAIPRTAVALGNGRLDIGFRFPDARSPKSAGVNGDERRLAVRLFSVRLSPAENRAQTK